MGSAGRLFLIGAVTIVTLYAAVVALMFVAQRTMLFPGAGGQREIAGPSPIGQWVEIATPDGERLAALYQPPTDGKPVVLFFHGNGDEIRGYGFLAKAFAERGDGFLAPAFRGYPGSTGSPSEAGILTDELAAYDWLASHAPNAPVAILAWSLGTGVAVNTAAERQVRALALVSAYDSIAAVAAGHYPYLPVKLLIRDPLRSDLRIGRVTAPKLFIHGDQDTVIPIARARALFDATRDPKTFIDLPGTGHNDIWTQETFSAIAGFFDQGETPGR